MHGTKARPTTLDMPFMLLESSIMLLGNIDSTADTHDDHHLRSSYFYSTSHKFFYQSSILLIYFSPFTSSTNSGGIRTPDLRVISCVLYHCAANPGFLPLPLSLTLLLGDSKALYHKTYYSCNLQFPKKARVFFP